MGTLQDLAVSLDDSRQQEEPVFRPETADRGETSPIRSSAAAYRDINRQLGSFYESPPKEDDQKTLELEWRIQELERQAEESRKAKEAGDEQLRLMEKSYEMAARYMPGASQEAKQSAVTSASGKRAVSPVKQVAGQVVSLLLRRCLTGSSCVSTASREIWVSIPFQRAEANRQGTAYVPA